MAEIVRRRSWGGVLPLGRHASISGSSFIQCASASIAPPHPGGPKCYPGAEVQGRTGSRGAPVVLGRSRTLGMVFAAAGVSWRFVVGALSRPLAWATHERVHQLGAKRRFGDFMLLFRPRQVV